MPWEWLKDNIGSIIILILVAVMLVLLIVYLVKGKKKGGCSGCAGCPHAASCPSKMLGNRNAKSEEITEPCEKNGKKE